MDAELDEEIRIHLDLLTADYRRRGMSPEQARHAARRAFGGVEPMKERYRESRGIALLDDLLRDVQYSIRGLCRNPSFTSVALMTLALGIGANTAIFALVNGLLLKSLPVREPAQLALLGDVNRESPAWNYAMWEQLRGRRELGEGAFAWAPEQFTIGLGSESRTVDGVWASGEMFDVLGVAPRLGRLLTRADDVRGGGSSGPVAVISHDVWQRLFGGAADVIGKTLRVDSFPVTVIGVSPPSFLGPDVGRRFDLALPIGAEPLLHGTNSSVDRLARFWLRIMVRKRADQTFESNAAALRRLQPQLVNTIVSAGLQPQLGEMLRSPVTLTPAARGRSTLRDQYRRPLLILMAVVSAVLLLACVNIANLLLARASARRQEMSLRLSLGASRSRLARLLLTEATLLSLVGAAIGFLLSQSIGRLLMRQLSTEQAVVFVDLTPDSRVMLFTSLVAVTTAFLFGTVPAWQAGRTDPAEVLADQRRGVGGGGRMPIAAALLAVQVALSLTLVVGAGLFIRTFAGLALRSLGFSKERVLVVTVSKPANRDNPAQLVDLYDRVVSAVRSVPGIQQAALSDLTPMGDGSRVTGVRLPGAPAGGAEQMAATNVIGPGWLDTYGMRLLAGRDFSAADRIDAPAAALVNETFTRQFLAGRNPVGAVVDVGFGRDLQRVNIVGLVQDSVSESMRDPVLPTVLTAASQRVAGRTSVNVSVRSAHAAPASLSSSIAAAVASVDPSLVVRFRTLQDQVDAAIRQERITAIVSGFFGVVALLLAGVGLYGVTAYTVGHRRAEMGVRLALGAARSGVIRLVMRSISFPVTAGIVAGAILSLWSSRFASTLLWELEPNDPATFAAAATLLVAVAMVAAWLPAWRVSRINPATVLRD